MYILTNEDLVLLGQMHSYLQHDCKMSPDSGCEMYEELEQAYGRAKDRAKVHLSNTHKE